MFTAHKGAIRYVQCLILNYFVFVCLWKTCVIRFDLRANIQTNMFCRDQSGLFTIIAFKNIFSFYFS